MSMKEKYRITMDVLTPIHIGSGEIFASSEYIVDEAKFKVNNEITTETVIRKIDVIEFFDSLSKTEQDVFLKELKNLKFSLNNPEFNSYSDNLNFKDKFKKSNLKKYEEKIYKTSWANEPGAKKDIECAAKSNGYLYVPGSSIKGSIRAALFYNMIELDDVPELMHYISKNDFDVPINNCFASNVLKNPAQGNIMRFLQVSDSTITKQRPRIYEIMPITLKRPDRRNRNPFRESPFAKRYLECIDSKRKLYTKITTNLTDLVNKELEFGDKVKCLDIKFIKESLYKFADDLLYNEVGFCQENGLNDLAKSYDHIWGENSFKQPLLLLGSTTGFHSKSVYLKIKKYDDEYGTEYLKDLEKHLDFKFTRNWDFPKTRRFTQVDKLPLGWVKLTFKKLK